MKNIIKDEIHRKVYDEFKIIGDIIVVETAKEIAKGGNNYEIDSNQGYQS